MPQQSSPSRVAGKNYRTFTHGGVNYLLSQPLQLGSYGDEESLILWKRRDPGEFGLRMVSRLPASYHASIWEGCARAAMDGTPSEAEWASYNASSWKTAYMFWHTLDSKHKIDKETKRPIDLIDGVQWALGVISSLPAEQLKELLLKIAAVSQDIAIKNSSGRPATPEPAQDQPLDTHITTDGPPFTNISETDTNSDPPT